MNWTNGGGGSERAHCNDEENVENCTAYDGSNSHVHLIREEHSDQTGEQLRRTATRGHECRPRHVLNTPQKFCCLLAQVNQIQIPLFFNNSVQSVQNWQFFFSF